MLVSRWKMLWRSLRSWAKDTSIHNVCMCVHMDGRTQVCTVGKKIICTLHQFSSFLWFLRLHVTVLCWSMHAGVCRQQDACIPSAWEGILWWTASPEWQIVSCRCHKSRPLPLSATFKHSQEATGSTQAERDKQNSGTTNPPNNTCGPLSVMLGRRARRSKEHHDKRDPVVTPACLCLSSS